MLWGNKTKRIDDLEDIIERHKKALNDMLEHYQCFRMRTNSHLDLLERRIGHLEASQQIQTLTPRDQEKIASFVASKKSTTDTNRPLTDKEKYGHGFTPRDWDNASRDADIATYMAASMAASAVSDDTPSRSSSSCDSSSRSSSYDSGSSYSSSDSSSGSCDSSSGSCD